jgi:hypothetical protein
MKVEIESYKSKNPIIGLVTAVPGVISCMPQFRVHTSLTSLTSLAWSRLSKF